MEAKHDAEDTVSLDSVKTTVSRDEAAANPDPQSKETPSSGKSNKVVVTFKSVGNAPILNKKKFFVDPDNDIASMIVFVRKHLRLDQSHSLFLYVNQSFAPSPDQKLRNLHNCFATDGNLILNYCLTEAWG